MTKMMVGDGLKHLVQLYHKNKQLLDDGNLTVSLGTSNKLLLINKLEDKNCHSLLLTLGNVSWDEHSQKLM